MPPLPRLRSEPGGDAYNAGKKHPQNSTFSKNINGRFWRDNSMEALARNEHADASAEVARRRSNANADRARRREGRLRTIEKRMQEDERRIVKLESLRRVASLPGLPPTRRELLEDDYDSSEDAVIDAVGGVALSSSRSETPEDVPVALSSAYSPRARRRG